MYIHHIIETFSVVGSVPTPLNNLPNPPPHILYQVEIRAVALADWLVCESDALTFSCDK
jgi:hypothetical protein